ncbi:MAG: hypothetical protein ACE5SW_09945 [Nitrososphaeraceae archaeon]
MKTVKTISHKTYRLEEKVENQTISFPTLADKFLTYDDKINCLQISIGLKDALIKRGFTIDSILNTDPAEIAEKLRIDKYVGQIIFEEAKKLRS